MKVWALHLPQFYETKENNEWWGKGFTEWTSVKNAKPLYSGHMQPMIPLKNNYYDLSKVENIKWQAELANNYGIEGFVFYHYWYSGRKLLEKPCESLLANTDINIKYCFCWANHSWTRAWDGKDHEILVKQTYGDKSEWDEHFHYLLDFFQDKRYLRINDMPVLFIYKPNDIPDGDERINYWNTRLKEFGIPGLFVVEYLSSFNPRPSLKTSRAVYEDEPNFSCRFKIGPFNKIKRGICKTLRITDYQSYDKLWRLNLAKQDSYGEKLIINGGFPRWDNSPRKGINSRVIKGASPQKFEHYLSLMKNISRKNNSNILLLNAWNEWGEGAMLEPTEQEGFGYLEAIRKVFGNNA